MQNLDETLTLFSAEIEYRGNDPVLLVPEQELEIGALEEDGTYRVAVFPTMDVEPVSQGGSASGRTQAIQEGSEPPVSEGDVVEVEIEDVGEQGDGIARVGPGYVIFVPDTKAGDRVKIEIGRVHDNFAFAEVIENEPITG